MSFHAGAGYREECRDPPAVPSRCRRQPKTLRWRTQYRRVVRFRFLVDRTREVTGARGSQESCRAATARRSRVAAPADSAAYAAIGAGATPEERIISKACGACPVRSRFPIPQRPPAILKIRRFILDTTGQVGG